MPSLADLLRNDPWGAPPSTPLAKTVTDVGFDPSLGFAGAVQTYLSRLKKMQGGLAQDMLDTAADPNAEGIQRAANLLGGLGLKVANVPMALMPSAQELRDRGYQSGASPEMQAVGGALGDMVNIPEPASVGTLLAGLGKAAVGAKGLAGAAAMAGKSAAVAPLGKGLGSLLADATPAEQAALKARLEAEAAQTGGQASSVSREQALNGLTGRQDYPALLKSLGPDYAGATVIGPDGSVLHNPITGSGQIGGPAVWMQPDGTYKTGIIAYHGSPHSFDKFDMSKIGTGEGAQAYGHGLYFAQHEGTAQSYRDVLSSNRAPSQEDLSKLSFDDQMKVSDAIQSAGEKAGFNTSSPDAFWMVINKLAGHESKTMHPVHDRAMLALDEVVKHVPEDVKSIVAQSVTPAKGSMYQVHLDVKPHELLDWDKPLSEQPEGVRKIFEDYGASDSRVSPYEEKWIAKDRANGWSFHGTESEAQAALAGRLKGENLHQSLKEIAGNAEASDLLRSHGIKGIRYKDAGSRDGSGGTHNFVIFDDKLITILKKYGIPMTAGAGGAVIISGRNMPADVASQLQQQ